VTGRQGRRCKQLLIDLEERRECCKLRGETLNGSVWGTHFERVHGPVGRETNE
jgi:hypothetical protein